MDIVTDVMDGDGRKHLEKLSHASDINLRIKESGQCLSFGSLFQDAAFYDILRCADLVHAYDIQAVFFLRKYCKANNLKVKVLCSISSLPKLDFKSLFVGPTETTSLEDGTKRPFFYSLWLRWVYSEVDFIVATRHSLKDRLAEMGVQKEKIVVVDAAVDPRIFPPSLKAGTGRVIPMSSVEAIAEQYLHLYQGILKDGNRYWARDAYSEKGTVETYDKVRFSSLSGRLFDRSEKRFLLSSVSHDKNISILEVGSGTGRFLIALAQEGYQNLNATDISQPLLVILLRKVTQAGFSDRIKASVGDIYHLHYRSSSLDCVYALRVLNQLDGNANRKAALRELMRIVKPSGRLIVDMVNKFSLAALRERLAATRGHDTYMSVRQLKKIVQEVPGFKVKRVAHRMSFSQTLMEKAPFPLTYLVYYADLLFSTIVPLWGTRVYFAIWRLPMNDEPGECLSTWKPRSNRSILLA